MVVDQTFEGVCLMGKNAKLGRPLTFERGFWHQDHVKMNVAKIIVA
jgi:hypothetical protein